MQRRNVGDTLYPLKAQLMASGAPINLSGCTVTVSMKGTGGVKINSASCAVIDAPNGIVSYQPLSADFDTAGDYLVQFRVVTGTALVLHVPTLGDTFTLAPAVNN